MPVNPFDPALFLTLFITLFLSAWAWIWLFGTIRDEYRRDGFTDRQMIGTKVVGWVTFAIWAGILYAGTVSTLNSWDQRDKSLADRHESFKASGEALAFATSLHFDLVCTADGYIPKDPWLTQNGLPCIERDGYRIWRSKIDVTTRSGRIEFDVFHLGHVTPEGKVEHILDYSPGTRIDMVPETFEMKNEEGIVLGRNLTAAFVAP